jgi:hypothetical protein
VSDRVTNGRCRSPCNVGTRDRIRLVARQRERGRRQERRTERTHENDDPPHSHAVPPKTTARIAYFPRCVRESYLTSWSISNIGMYVEITITPTIAPTPIIMISTIEEVRDLAEHRRRRGVDLTGISLGRGLVSSSGAAVVEQQASGLSGFALAAGASRKFVFTVKGVKSGTVTLTASATGKASSGAVRGSGNAKLNIGSAISGTVYGISCGGGSGEDDTCQQAGSAA